MTNIFVFNYSVFVYNNSNNKMNINAIIEKCEDGWYVGQIEEFPEAVSQGKTVKELQENLIDALHLVMDSQRVNSCD